MIAAISIWRLGAVYVPLFTAFGPDAIGIRVEDAGVTVVIADEAHCHKLDNLYKRVPIATVLTSSTNDGHRNSSSNSEHFWVDNTRSHEKHHVTTWNEISSHPAVLQPSEPIALLYTSGTTGLPKGVPISAYSLASFHMYMQYGLGLQCGDMATNISSWITPHTCGSSFADASSCDIYQRYYSSADTGWAYGFYYNLIGPLLLGIPVTYPAVGPFHPQKLLQVLSDCNVTHFATSPSALRSLRAFDMEEQEKKRSSSFDQFSTPMLSYSSSAGEPLSSTLNTWWMSRMTSRKPLADHYGQSEIGMLVNCHWGDCLLSGRSPSSLVQKYPIGTMGCSMPGYRCVTLDSTEHEIPPTTECSGQLAIDIPASPLYWFQGYWNQPNRTAKCYSSSKKYYLTGDLVHQGQNPDEPISIPNESLFWYISRNDDIITSSGYRIGPSDIERCLLKDPRVKDVGVYGVKDPEGLRGEVRINITLHHFSLDHSCKHRFTPNL